MAKTVAMIITNDNILVRDNESDEFKTFTMPSLNPSPNIPFYHEFAEKIAECQYYFKEFMKGIYGKKLNKYILAIIVPDDTSKLESIFINEFFVNSGACKAVAQMPIANNETVVRKLYDIHTCNPKQVMSDAEKIHIDVEYNDVPIFVNNFNMNMDEYIEMGEIISTKQFMEKISNIDVEKL